MREQKRIPVSKVARAMKFVKTGAKVGGNYIKHYSRKAIDPSVDKSELHIDNASDIYGSLSELKGSALKVAQMLAMDKNMLPQAYQDKFMMAQYSAPPLSYPLVVKTFTRTMGNPPSFYFEEFSKNAIQAASMGQVHKARTGNKNFAVKVQYPGVAESVRSDLKLVRPFAVRLMNINEKELDLYFEEVEAKLMEETDYGLELDRSIEITGKCQHLNGINFPDYYPEYSSPGILTMDWIDGLHMKEFLKTSPSRELRNKIGQALWNFYDFQIHNLKTVHADPHPGNFIIGENGNVNVIDFGCVKVIPDGFYRDYFSLLQSQLNDLEMIEIFERLNFLLSSDNSDERKLFIGLFKEMIELISMPFKTERFNFGNDSFFKAIYDLSERISKMEEVRKASAARGSRHGLYINRTYFGLYNLLNMLQAEIITSYQQPLKATGT